MKIEKKTLEGTLTAEFVDEASTSIRKFLTSLKLSKQEITRYCLSAEEILLDFMDTDAGRAVKITTGKKLFSPYFNIEIDGTAKNVFIKEGTHSFLGDSILYNLNLSPDYNYVSGRNEYSFKFKAKKLNPFFVMFIAVFLAVGLGTLSRVFFADVMEGVIEGFITPIYEAFLNVLSCIAGPMIFLSVAWGIYGIGDVATLKRVGKKVFSGFVSTLYIVLIISAFAMLPFFKFNYMENVGKSSEFSSIFSMILQIFPKDIVSPFSTGNTLQIIFLAIIIGIALIFLGKKTTSVAKAIEQINYVIQFLIEFITKLVPFFIFIVLFQMIVSSTLDSFLGVWKLFLVLFCLNILATVLIISFTAIKNKVSAFTLLKKGFPTFVTALTTASSSAAFAVNVKTAHEKLGVEKSVVSFGIPLGIVLCKIATSLNYLTLVFYFSEAYGLEISIFWFVLAVFTSGILSMATPPIPGGAAIAYTILLTQFGIPMEALAITLACDVIFDFMNTGFNQLLFPFVLVNQTAKLGLLDTAVLRSKK